MYSVPALDALIGQLQQLNGIGPKSAARIAYQLLHHERALGVELTRALTHALEEVGHCSQCQSFCNQSPCAMCTDTRREHTQLCVVETPADLMAIEQTGIYHGLYFVLMGRISPLDNVGPHEIGIERLFNRLDQAELAEVIVATNFTAEGETTAHVISHFALKKGLNVSRLARGVPIGSELEHVDLGTIAHAFSDRRFT